MEYNEIINRIVEAENTAQQMSNEANSKRSALDEDLKTEREKMRASYFERAQRRLSVVAEQEEKAAREKIAALDSQLAHDLQTVDELYEKNHTQWVDKLFARIVGA